MNEVSVQPDLLYREPSSSLSKGWRVWTNVELDGDSAMLCL